ncbi:hypothetical protein [Thioalkalivibrio sp. HK1]|uniref:hypothetical protein n=1 Tax=Thioalkalivibrio sp. HK1 TaxID=1469245 RepID=UPI0012DCDE57|nr:hypothetical protein [Thioalkalivibrio sp. HK1]
MRESKSSLSQEEIKIIHDKVMDVVCHAFVRGEVVIDQQQIDNIFNCVTTAYLNACRSADKILSLDKAQIDQLVEQYNDAKSRG